MARGNKPQIKVIKEITRPVVKDLRSELEAAIDMVARRHGLIGEVGNISFNNVSLKVKMELAVVKEEGVESIEAQTFRTKAAMYGLKPEWLGQMFSDYKGDTFTVIGCVPARRKYPITIERGRDKTRRKVTPGYVREADIMKMFPPKGTK